MGIAYRRVSFNNISQQSTALISKASLSTNVAYEFRIIDTAGQDESFILKEGCIYGTHVYVFVYSIVHSGQGQGFNLPYNNTAKAQNLTPRQGLQPMQMPLLTDSQGHGQGQLSFSGHGSGSSAGESYGRITAVQTRHQHQPTPPPPQAQTPHAHSQTHSQIQPTTPGWSASFSPKLARPASFPPKRAVAISQSESHCHSVSMNLISPNQTQGRTQTLRQQSDSQPQGQRQGGPSLPPPQQGTISLAETQRRAPSSSPVQAAVTLA
ncbi:hypothetical protein B0H14DRAFT_3620542 [Mycena olivaceomarginata]|nr:hypothetical protein B0H14DRAFT_3620542 [Mycena olivaceomarginata]